MKISRKISIWVIAIVAFLAAGGVFYAQAQQFEDSNIVTVRTQSGTTEAPYALYCSPLKSSSRITVYWLGSVSRPHTLDLYSNAGVDNGYPDRPVKFFSPGAPGSFTEVDITPNTDITYQLKTNYTDGKTPTLETSNTAICGTSGAAGGDVPTNFSIFARDASTLILNWKDNVVSTRPYDFEIQRIKATPLASTDFSVTGRQTNSVSLKWKNATGYSPYSSVLERSTSTSAGIRFSKDDVSSSSITNNSYNPPASLSASPQNFNYTDNGVSEATTYYYRLKACSILPVGSLYMKGGSGNVILNPDKPLLACGDYTNNGAVVATTTPPIAPSNLIATAISSSEIKLTWQDNSGKENGFYIYRSDTVDPIATLGASIGTGVMSYNDTNLKSGSSYSYTVKSFVTDPLNGQKLLSDASSPGTATTLQLPETIRVKAYLNGTEVTGGAITVNFSLSDPAGQTVISGDRAVPYENTVDYLTGQDNRFYFTYVSGGPVGATFQQIKWINETGGGGPTAGLTSTGNGFIAKDGGWLEYQIYFTSGSGAAPANHPYANMYDSARGWLARQSERLITTGNDLWKGLVSLLEKGQRFIADDLFGVEVGLSQTQSINYDDYFNLNKFSVAAPFRLDIGLDANSIYLYRVRVSYTDGATPATGLWSDIMAGKTFNDGAGVTVGSTGQPAPICKNNSLCDRTVMGTKVTDNNTGAIIEQSEIQCQVNADCANVGRSSKTFQEQ